LNHVAQKNCEKFDILHIRKMLSARWLQKNDEASIYNNADNSENFNVLQSHNMLSERHLQKPLKFLLTYR